MTTHCVSGSQRHSPDDWIKEIAFACGYIILTGRKPRPDGFATFRHPSTGLTLVLRRNPLESLGIFGGYLDPERERFYLVIRWMREHKSFDGVFRLDPQNRVRLVHPSVRTCLPSHQYEDFLLLPEGRSFTILGRSMTKLTKYEIETKVRDRTFRLSNRVEGDT
jgi:hypothetical protein